MILYNLYLLSLAALFGGSTALLAAYGLERLDAYFTVYVIEYLTVTLLFASLHPRARALLDSLATLLVGGVLGIIVLKVLALLKGS